MAYSHQIMCIDATLITVCGTMLSTTRNATASCTSLTEEPATETQLLLFVAELPASAHSTIREVLTRLERQLREPSMSLLISPGFPVSYFPMSGWPGSVNIFIAEVSSEAGTTCSQAATTAFPLLFVPEE